MEQLDIVILIYKLSVSFNLTVQGYILCKNRIINLLILFYFYICNIHHICVSWQHNPQYNILKTFLCIKATIFIPNTVHCNIFQHIVIRVFDEEYCDI